MHEHDWFYRVYDRQTPATVFGPFAPIVELWRSKAVDGGIPDWNDFDFKDFIGWYGHISLGELKPDFSEMIFLLWGTVLTELWGKDYTGLTMKDVAIPDHWPTIEQPYIEALVKQDGIGVCGGTLHVFERDFVNVTYIDLPVSRSGKTPYIMSVYLRDVDRSSLETEKPSYSYIERYEPGSG